MTVHRVTPTSAATPVLGLAPTGNELNACSTTGGDNSCNLAAVAIVISHGANQGGGFPPRSAIAMPTGQANIFETPNFNNDVQFFQNGYVKNGANAFDDILVAIPARDDISTLRQKNTLKDPRVSMNEQFEAIKLAIIQQSYSLKGTATTITLTVSNVGTATYTLPGTTTLDISSCGVVSADTQLPPTTTVAALTGLTTGIWGSPIRYKRIATSPFGAANLCVTPFFLLSYGPDGLTGGQVAIGITSFSRLPKARSMRRLSNLAVGRKN